jgi:hypothetical protein
MVEFLQGLIAPEGYSVSIFAALAPLIGPALGAIGGIFKNRKGAQTDESQSSFDRTQTGTSTTSGTTSFDRTDTAGFGEEGLGALRGLFGRGQLELDRGLPITRGDIEGGANAQAQQINARTRGLFDTLQGNAISRGLGAPGGAGGALARGLSEQFRGGALTGLNIDTANQLQQLPLLQEKIRQSRFANLANLLPLFSRQATSQGTTQQDQTTTSQQDSSGTQQGTVGPQKGGVLGDILGSIGGILPAAFPGRFGGNGGGNGSRPALQTPDFDAGGRGGLNVGQNQPTLPPGIFGQSPIANVPAPIQNNQFQTTRRI